MAVSDEQFLDSSLSPRADLESPFLHGELFVAGTAAGWEPPGDPLSAESPFQRAFATAEPIAAERLTSDEEHYAPDWESPLFESGSANPLRALAPSELKAVRITSTFETGRPGSYGGLTGNFDGQGVSFGLMNYAWKAGSLVTLLQEFLRDQPTAFADVFGPDAARFRKVLLAAKPDPKNPARQVRDVERQMEFARHVMNDTKNQIREPWRTYFNRLETSPAFQRIQVKAVRRALQRARFWCDYFGLKTERAFVFMFDVVTQQGAAWLNAPKFKGRRRDLLRSRLEHKQAALGRPELTELEKLEVIANMLADVSLPRWRDDVRVRKMWFVRGRGTVHGDFWDIAKDFGVTDSPPDFGAMRGLNEFDDEAQEGGSAEIGEAGDPEEEWGDALAEPLPPHESADHFEAQSDEDALSDEWESGEELEWTEPEEESLADDGTLAHEAVFEPSGTDFELEDELEIEIDDLTDEALYVDEGARLDEESFVEPEDKVDLDQETDPPQGQTLYLPVELNKTVPPKVGVFISSSFRPTAELDIIVYFHGHIIPRCQTQQQAFTRDGIQYYWETPLFTCLRKDLAASGRNAILIAPTFIPIFAGKGNNAHDYGDLNQAGKFDFLINSVLAQLKLSSTVPQGAQVRRIILSGHSGGGLPMQAILAANNTLNHKIDECWGFECLYFGTEVWANWLSGSPSRHFRHHRQPKTFAGPTSTLRKHTNFIDVADATDHCRVVQENWRQALDASHVLRGEARTRPVGAGSPVASTRGGAMSTLSAVLAGLPGLATLPLTFMTALLQGFRDENHLVNLVFWARHPELAGRKLHRSDPRSLKDEWVSIQTTIVRPAVRRLNQTTAITTTAPGAGLPRTLVTTPDWHASDATSEYALTDAHRKILAAQSPAERAADRTALAGARSRTRLATLTAAEKRGRLRAGETQELAQLRALESRTVTAQTALKRRDVEEVLAAAGWTVPQWYGQIQRGSFLGIPLRVHRALAERLTRAEAKLVADPAVNPQKLDAAALGTTLKMYPSTSDMRSAKPATSGAALSMHTFGLAVDLNYTGNPFVGNGGALVPQIVQRATGLVLGTRIDLLANIGQAREAYHTLTKASEALKMYLTYRDPANLAELTAKVRAYSPGSGDPHDVAGWLARIERDHTDLQHAADFKNHKKPEEGFIDLHEAVVLALADAGLTWGGTYPEAKDIMHFDLRQGDGAKVDSARRGHRANV